MNKNPIKILLVDCWTQVYPYSWGCLSIVSRFESQSFNFTDFLEQVSRWSLFSSKCFSKFFLFWQFSTRSHHILQIHSFGSFILIIRFRYPHPSEGIQTSQNTSSDPCRKNPFLRCWNPDFHVLTLNLVFDFAQQSVAESFEQCCATR